MWDITTYPCLRCLLLATKSWYIATVYESFICWFKIREIHMQLNASYGRHWRQSGRNFVLLAFLCLSICKQFLFESQSDKNHKISYQLCLQRGNGEMKQWSRRDYPSGDTVVVYLMYTDIGVSYMPMFYCFVIQITLIKENIPYEPCS